ncbi:PREDICTED: odorant receptor 4-like [Eufriesea mexicana]|uniref:odorant receptor 4-like n=1 Tax=Eufriesea mexicana TaxID=516756 RepID=UPI00083C691D|nr:PREDICTED: odorant receptor 4-like [Eufriesea mexicana]
MSRGSVEKQKTTRSLNEYSLQLNRWFLKPIGAWPLSSSSSKRERIISFLLNVSCYGFVFFTAIPGLFHIILEDETIGKRLKIFAPLSHWFFGGINYTTLLMQGKEIHDCIQHMQTDWQIVTRINDQKVMMMYAKIGRYVAGFCAAFVQGGVLIYCVVTGIATETIIAGNETRIVHKLPCAAYKNLIPVDTSPTNEIVLASQFVSGFIVNSTAVGSVSIAAVFAAHACGQLNVVMIWINEFVNQSKVDNKNVGFNKIGDIVQHHLRVLRFIAGIENIMNRICFMELFECTINICMLGYYILTEWHERNIQNLASYFIVLMSMIFNIFIICYIGDILTEKCKKIGEVVYMTNWYYLPYKDILDLIQIILRSSLVIEITAGKLIHMSIYTFGDVMKTAFAYLNLLRHIT